MIEFATIARPYAKAIFELAESEQQADNWQTSLKEAAWLVRQPQVEVLIAQTDTVSTMAVLPDTNVRKELT